ncbi:MAG: hypothetical protein LUG84_08535 [Akkermansiaceae bacterium]|nr:hypothetical protein [Akkermansiaceae bacterium]
MAFESSEDSQKEGIGKLTGPELLCIELLFHLLESETRKNIWDSGDNLYGADPHPGMKNKGKNEWEWIWYLSVWPFGSISGKMSGKEQRCRFNQENYTFTKVSRCA